LPQTLPSDLGNLHNLEELRLDYCSSLKKLPDSVGSSSSLPKLRLLSINACNSLKLSASIIERNTVPGGLVLLF
jgi:hypothetical protein